jgi:hypothetical protein
MAITGVGREYDVPMKASTYVKTSTAQYKAVGMGWETTTADWTVYMCDAGSGLDDTMTARGFVGIVQDVPSANSEFVTVRMFGLSKAWCASTIAAGDVVAAYEGISTTTFPGHIVTLTMAASVPAMRVVGIAMEDGRTNTAITVFVNPTIVQNI